MPRLTPRPFRTALLAAVGSLALTAAATATAQSGQAELLPPDGSGPTEQRLNQLTEQYGSIDDVRLSIDFPGGAASDYLDLLQDTVGVRNIVSNRPLDAIDIGPVQLTAVRYQDAVALFVQLATNSGIDATANFREGIYTIQLRGADARDRRVGEWVYTAPAALVADRDDDDALHEILAGVEAAIAFLDDPELDISVHEPSGTLLVRGPRQSLQIVHDTVTQLAEQMIERRNQQSERDDLERELGEALQEIQGLTFQSRTDAAEFNEIEADLRAAIEETERELQRARIEADALVENATREARLDNERLRVRYEESQAIIASQRERLERSESERAELIAEIARLEGEADRLREENEEINGRLFWQASEIERLRQQVERLGGEPDDDE